jgi:hypothetical protein
MGERSLNDCVYSISNAHNATRIVRSLCSSDRQLIIVNCWMYDTCLINNKRYDQICYRSSTYRACICSRVQYIYMDVYELTYPTRISTQRTSGRSYFRLYAQTKKRVVFASMQTFYIKPVNRYESDGNELAQCMERNTICGCRRYSLILLMLLMALIGVSVTLGVVINEPRSKCFGNRIRSNGTYDPTQHCLTWSSNGLTSMPDGTCPNECDQELYNNHMTHSNRRLGQLDDYCGSACPTSISDVDNSNTYEPNLGDCTGCCQSPGSLTLPDNPTACDVGRYLYSQRDYCPSTSEFREYCVRFNRTFIPAIQNNEYDLFMSRCSSGSGMSSTYVLASNNYETLAGAVIQLYNINCGQTIGATTIPYDPSADLL